MAPLLSVFITHTLSYVEFAVLSFLCICIVLTRGFKFIINTLSLLVLVSLVSL